MIFFKFVDFFLILFFLKKNTKFSRKVKGQQWIGQPRRANRENRHIPMRALASLLGWPTMGGAWALATLLALKALGRSSPWPRRSRRLCRKQVPTVDGYTTQYVCLSCAIYKQKWLLWSKIHAYACLAAPRLTLQLTWPNRQLMPFFENFKEGRGEDPHLNIFQGSSQTSERWDSLAIGRRGCPYKWTDIHELQYCKMLIKPEYKSLKATTLTSNHPDSTLRDSIFQSETFILSV